MVLPEPRSENVARRARALEHCLEECGGCANRPETCWGPHLAVVGTFFTLTLARPTTSRGPSRRCVIPGHVCSARRPLDKVSDELLLESLPMLAVEGNSVVHPLQLGCHLTLTPFPTDH